MGQNKCQTPLLEFILLSTVVGFAGSVFACVCEFCDLQLGVQDYEFAEGRLALRLISEGRPGGVPAGC